MENTLASVEQGLIATQHQAEELRRAVVLQYAELERSRQALREDLVAFAASRRAVDVSSFERQHAASTRAASALPKSAPNDRFCVSLDADETKANGAEADEVAVERTSGGIRASEAASRGASMSSTVVPTQPSSPTPFTWHPLMLTTAIAPRLHETNFEQQTRAIHARSLQYQHRRLLQAAKLQFAQAWARLVRPWFDQVVCKGFLEPLMGRLTCLERRLRRLCTRMSLDLPRYTLRSGATEVGVGTAATCAPVRCAGCMPVLWSRYLDAATQQSPPRRSSFSSERRNTGGGASAAEVRLSPAVAATATAEGEANAASCVAVLNQPATTDTDTDKEEAILILPSMGDDMELRKMLLHTRRSLRHICYVMRYGLMESDGRTSTRATLTESEGTRDAVRRGSITPLQQTGEGPRPDSEYGRCGCGQSDGDQDLCLSCQVTKLVHRHSILASHLLMKHRDSMEVNWSPFLESCGSSFGGNRRAPEAIISLLKFIQHVCALHEALRSEKDRYSLRQHLSPAPKQTADVHDADIRNTCESSGYTERSGFLSLCERGQASLEQLVLLPFHLLEAVLNNFLDSHDAAESHALSAQRFGDGFSPLLQWWMSPSSCDCRCAYARALGLARLHLSSSRRLRPNASQNAESSCSFASDLPAFTGAARLCQWRNAELQMREEWQELHTKLLIARSMHPS
ncbi:hypothetical protein ABL78_6429 [Leptomonas seymouri]|uniref:Uncharacterized protein n=1 Tax=Leptomonas seymouri TaxID=5684 RepID=A0A0N0P3T9_LEPSE|nr:hypothetical protein ABL78_6429 [Leptomonas seymouri]|eukprot:KPI84519.1 hypothetical protein ABL78_6429 [Leptomonas seymouri]